MDPTNSYSPNMAGAIGVPALLIRNLTLVAMIQASSSCREEVCLSENNTLVGDAVSSEPKENKISRRRQSEHSTAIGLNQGPGLSVCLCDSGNPCLRKCCSKATALDRKTGKCMEAGTSTPASDTTLGTSEDSQLNNETSDVSCFSKCGPGKELLLTVLDEKKASSLRLMSGEFCTSHENGSSCLKSNEFCIDYISFPTGLAVAVCQNATSEKGKKHTWKGYDYPSPIMPLLIGVMLIISSLCLSATFLVYTCFHELRNLHGKCLLCHMGSLIVYYVVIIVRRFRSVEMRHDGSSCFALDVARFYFYLVPFSWLNVTCFDISMSFIKLMPRHGNFRRADRVKLILYSLYSWITPGAAFFLSLQIDLNSKGLGFSYININKWCKEKHLSSSNYRYIPMSLFMGLSVVLFVATTIRIYRINNSTSILRSGENTRRNVAEENKVNRFKLYVKLLVLMGFMSWVMEPIFWAVHEWVVADRVPFRSTVWFVVLVIRNLQGFYISVVFLWNDKVRTLVKKMRPGVASGISESPSHEMSSISQSRNPT